MLEELKNKIALERERLATEKNQAKLKEQYLQRLQKKQLPAKDSLKMSVSAATAFTEMSFSDYQLWVLLFSILADIFTLFPVVGNLMAILFAVFIWVIYFLNGHFKKDRWAAKMGVKVTADIFEILGFGINFLPFFTSSALINYWITLTERKAKKEEV